MTRHLFFALLIVPSLLPGAIWPDKLALFERKAQQPATPPDAALAQEFGFQAAEQAAYVSGSQSLSVTGWRLADPTGAMALVETLKPADARKSDLTAHAYTIPGGLLFQKGNYAIQIQGQLKDKSEFLDAVEKLPGYRGGSLPVLLSYLPQKDLIPNSERYIVGPVSLAKFESRIPADFARFDLSAEGYSGRYRLNGSEATLVIFNYPTPQMARDQVPALERIPGGKVKRSGPLLAVLLGAPDDAAAQGVLKDVEWELQLTKNYEKPLEISIQTWAQILTAIGQLIVALVIFAGSAGLMFGVGKVIKARLNPAEAAEPMISLHLSDHEQPPA
jgi:hypothetical protein